MPSVLTEPVYGLPRPASALIYPTATTYLNDGAPTANYSSAENLMIGGNWPGTSGYTRVVLLQFATRSFKRPCRKVMLNLVVSNRNDGIGGSFYVYPVLKAVALSVATWNIYATGQNWGLAGARQGGVDYNSQIGPGASNATGSSLGVPISLDVSPLVAASLASGEAWMTILVSGYGNDGNTLSVGSMSAAQSLRPFLHATFL